MVHDKYQVHTNIFIIYTESLYSYIAQPLFMYQECFLADEIKNEEFKKRSNLSEETLGLELSIIFSPTLNNEFFINSDLLLLFESHWSPYL